MPAAEQARSIAARIAGGSAMRPGPNSPQAIAPSSGPDDVDAARRQARQVAPGSPGAATCARSSPAPPARACRWRAAACGEVVGEPGRHLRHQVGGRRRHHHQIGAARELDMAHLALVGQREQGGVDLGLAQRRSDSGVTNCARRLRSARRCTAAPPLRSRRISSRPCRRRCRRRRSAARACRKASWLGQTPLASA